MSSFGAFQTSVLGMVSQSHALGVIGANIANVTTGGFKRTDAHFQTLLGQTAASRPAAAASQSRQSDIAGVTTKDYARISLQGELGNGDGGLDVAIDGPGFFVFGDNPAGAAAGSGMVYGRDGAFATRLGGPVTTTLPDGRTVSGVESFLSDAQGRYVLGWPATGAGAPVGGSALGPIRTDPYAFADAPEATGVVRLGLNLPSDAVAGSRESYSIDAFDNSGRLRPIELGFTRTGVNAWALDAMGAPGDALTLGPAPLADLSFSPTGTLLASAPFSLGIAHPDGGASAFALDLSAFTQMAGPLAPLGFERDGHEAGVLDTIDFDADGMVIGTFANGRSRPLYRLALADFANPDGLTPQSGNVFAESAASGAAMLGGANEDGFGAIVSGALERSNVDLSQEFTQMMVTQKAYNASATAFRTTDEMTTVARDLKE
ncbi:MAG: flagellar hook-basal body complex protein [Rhodospirillales bacterium]|nr:flagellar hook-basal body complex protein [Rhodospirillales bacterium]